MYTLSELKKQNKEIANLIEVISVLVKEQKLMTNPVVCDLITRFNEKVWMHLVFEENSIYSELLKHHNPQINELASQFHQSTREIRKEFSAYMKEWCKASGANHDQQAFCEKTSSMLNMIRQRIEFESKHMFPMVETEYAA